jgi:hypothetical protein
VIDHAQGKSDASVFYPMLNTALIQPLKGMHPKALASLGRNVGSKASLARWHRVQYSRATNKKAGGWASSVGKTVVRGGKKVVQFLAKHGVALAKKAWSTVQKCASQLKKLGVKAAKWVRR